MIPIWDAGPLWIGKVVRVYRAKYHWHRPFLGEVGVIVERHRVYIARKFSGYSWAVLFTDWKKEDFPANILHSMDDPTAVSDIMEAARRSITMTSSVEGNTCQCGKPVDLPLLGARMECVTSGNIRAAELKQTLDQRDQQGRRDAGFRPFAVYLRERGSEWAFDPVIGSYEDDDCSVWSYADLSSHEVKCLMAKGGACIRKKNGPRVGWTDAEGRLHEVTDDDMAEWGRYETAKNQRRYTG